MAIFGMQLSGAFASCMRRRRQPAATPKLVLQMMFSPVTLPAMADEAASCERRGQKPASRLRIAIFQAEIDFRFFAAF